MSGVGPALLSVHHLAKGHAMIRSALAGAVCLAILTLASTSAAASTPGTARLGQELDGLVAAGVPGAVVIVRDGRRNIEAARGLGQVEERVPIRAADRFRIGSLTKTYVATVVLQLAAEGKLRLDDRVDRWLPGVVRNGEGITVRQLLNHSSGIPEFDQDPRVLRPYLSGNLGYYWAPRRLIGIAQTHPPLFAPGARYSYSNTNYLVAGLIVEAVTHRPLAVELERRIFAPLHLGATSFPTAPGIAGRHAHGYLVLGKPPAIDVTGLSPYAWAAGAIVSTGADVASFYRALLSGRLLPRPQLAELETTVPAKSDLPDTRFGLGIFRYRLPCGVAWGFNGNFPGYLVYALSSANGQRQTVLLANEDPSSLPKAAGPLFVRVLERSYCG
jgi:D-alanyl-D-alanine carboxypeptidase